MQETTHADTVETTPQSTSPPTVSSKPPLSPSKKKRKVRKRRNDEIDPSGDHPCDDVSPDSNGFSHQFKEEQPPPPPSTTPNRTIEEYKLEYHSRNQQFLQDVQKMSSPLVTRPIFFASPSPGSIYHRKRLESIDEVEKEQQEGVETTLPHNQHTRDISWSSLGSSESSMSSYNCVREDAVALAYRQETRPTTTFEDKEHHRNTRQEKYDLERSLANVLDRHLPTQRDKARFVKNYLIKLEGERTNLLEQWRAEQPSLPQNDTSTDHAKTGEVANVKRGGWKSIVDAVFAILASAEVMIGNMPLTIGAVGLSWVAMGVVWFKFAEEVIDACVPVHFNSPRCTFPEFPGCFECDTTNDTYRWALRFHNGCTFVAGTCCMLFLLKLALAWRVVVDELSNPTTSAPCGVVCITLICVFAGRGDIGEAIVLVTSIFHFVLAFWFLYMALFQYGLWPDPGWFPNTVGIAYAAIKTWIYFPAPGLFLMMLCLVFFFATFFISVIRVALNRKIAAPVCWIQLSAPSITLYALTLVSQPSQHFQQLLEASPALALHFREAMDRWYLPSQHFMMFLMLVGLVSAVHSLYARWDKFVQKPFSPAHVAFCFPILSHTNAVQAYRGAVNAFSNIPAESPFRIVLFLYWTHCLVCGTLLNLVFTYKFVTRLPAWTKLDVSGEEEPPDPSETIVQEMIEEDGAHETMNQSFVSPAVLQANEAGVMIRVRRGTEDFRMHGPYVRTRQVPALGFDLTMDEEELRQERAELLDWVAKNAPRRRNRTMSIPTMMKLRDASGTNIYGTFVGSAGARHKRSRTSADVPFGGF